MISVALCTYNGARFIGPQLASILAQSRLPDEVVVSDDGSDDGTREIVRQVATTSPVPLRLLADGERRGVTRNFEACLRACRGDIVFLCDQDDLWHPDKLQRVAQAFERAPQAVLVYADARLVDAEGAELAPSWWRVAGLHPPPTDRAALLDLLLSRWVFSGFNMAVRRTLLERALPFEPVCHHDAWLALMAPHVGQIVLLPERCADYRQHGGNLTLPPAAVPAGPSPPTPPTPPPPPPDPAHAARRHFRAFADRAHVLERLLQRSAGGTLDAGYLRRCRAALAFCRDLGACTTRPRWRSALRLLAHAGRGRYARWRGGWRELARDLLRLGELRR